MTKLEFGKVVAYIAAATGKPLSEPAHEPYFDLLGDLDYHTLLTAAKRVLLEHRWASFPSIAELREAAAATIAGQVAALSPAEAWELAWRCAANTDPEVEGSFARAAKNLPTLVVEAMTSFGVNALCYGREPVGVVRGQFMKIYEQLAAREQRRALMPAALRKAIEPRQPPLKFIAELAAGMDPNREAAS